MKILKEQLNSMVTTFSPIQPLTISKTLFNSAAFLPLELMNLKPLPRITKTSQKDKAPITILADNQLTSFLQQMITNSTPKTFSTNSK